MVELVTLSWKTTLSGVWATERQSWGWIGESSTEYGVHLWSIYYLQVPLLYVWYVRQTSRDSVIQS